IVMLARDAQAFLTIDYARTRGRADAQEVILELDHPGVGEQQGGIALGNQRRRRHDRMTARGEEIEKRPSNLCSSPAHGEFIVAGEGKITKLSANPPVGGGVPPPPIIRAPRRWRARPLPTA